MKWYNREHQNLFATMKLSQASWLSGTKFFIVPQNLVVFPLSSFFLLFAYAHSLQIWQYIVVSPFNLFGFKFFSDRWREFKTSVTDINFLIINDQFVKVFFF